ncbi:MAG: YcxB family protein [Armatimonas sp.]
MPVHASFHWTEDEYRRVVQHHFRKTIRPSIRYFVGGVLMLLGLLCVYGLILSAQRPGPSEGQATVVGMTAFFLFTSLGIMFEEKVAVFFGQRSFLARKDANALVQWEFDSQRLHQATDTGLRADFPWEVVRQVLEVSDGFLLAVPKQFFWVPFSAFEQAEGPQQFRELAAQNQVPLRRR